MSRKSRWLVWLTLLLLVLPLAACGGRQAPAGGTGSDQQAASSPAPSTADSGSQAAQPPAEPVTLRWGIYADPARQEVSELQAKAFMDKHPDITVTVEAVPFGTYYEKLGTQLAAGTGYDVMLISGSYFPQIAPQGGLLDLTDRIRADQLDLGQYTTEQANSEHEGRIYALPYELDIQALFYNKDMFDAADVDYPDETWTWDDLLAAARRLTGTNADGQKVWGFYSENLYPSWVSFVAQAGGSFFDAAGQPTIDTPEAIAALQFMRDLMYVHKVSPTPGEIPQGVNLFHTGLVAMRIDGSYSVRPTEQTVKFAWDVAPLPMGRQRGAAYWTQGIAIAAKTAHPDAAWEFAKFLMGEEAQRILAETKMAAPSLKSVATGDVYLQGGPSGMRAFIDGYEHGAPIPFNAHWFDIMRGPNSSMGEPFSNLWLDQISAAEAAQQAQANTLQVLDQ